MSYKFFLTLRGILFIFFVSRVFMNVSYAQENTGKKVQPFGRIFTIYYHNFSNSFSNTQPNNDFYFKTIDLGLKGSITDYLSFRIMLIPDKQRKIIVYDGYFSIKYPSFPELRIGQFKPPFSMEGLLPDPEKDFVNNARSTGLVLSRDLGVGLFYNHDYGELNLALHNGSGLNEPEDNTVKDFVGRLIIKPTNNTRLGGAAYFGWNGPDSNLTKKNRLNFQAEYKVPQFHVRSEYVLTEDGNIKGRDYYIQAGYRMNFEYDYLQQVEPLVRYEDYDPDNNVLENNTEYITIGLNFYLKGHDFKWLFNYVWENDHKNKTISNKFFVGIQLVF